MTNNLVVIYPCNLGSCSKNCGCDFCEQTRSNSCPLKKHKKHLENFDIECVVQKDSQCQIHWVGHPENFNEAEDIVIEKNMF